MALLLPKYHYRSGGSLTWSKSLKYHYTPVPTVQHTPKNYMHRDENISATDLRTCPFDPLESISTFTLSVLGIILLVIDKLCSNTYTTTDTPTCPLMPSQTIRLWLLSVNLLAWYCKYTYSYNKCMYVHASLTHPKILVS